MLGTENGINNTTTYDIYVIGEQIRMQMYRANMIRDRRFHLRKYRKCFIGRDAVDWLVRMCHAQSRGEAVVAMRCLQEHGMLNHVTDDHVFKDQHLFFRFIRDDGDRYLLRSDLTAFYRGLDVFNSIKDAGIRRDFYHRGHLYQGSFYGNDLVDCLVAQGDGLERADVIRQCRELLEFDIIRHVTDDYHFSDDRLMYQFRVDYERPCLLSDVLHVQEPRSTLFATDAHASTASSEPGISRQVSSGADGSERVTMRSSSSSSGVPGPPGSLDGDYFIQQDSNTISGTDDEEVAECGSRKVVPPVKLVERVVKLQQDDVGYGFVLRGTSPCYVHTIDPLGPAAAAGLKEGQYVLSVGGQNVKKYDHRHVGRLVMSHTGLLTLVVWTRVHSEQ